MLSLLTLSLGMVLSQAEPQPANPAPAAAAPAAPAADANTGPKIEFATPIYDFGKVKGGDPVKYTYYFTNTGNEVLEVKAVQPSCGCTTAGEFSRKVEPGKTGTIPIQFNSANFNGQVFKTITVTSSAKNTPSSVLQLKGMIWKAIELVPAYTVLNIPPDAQSGTATVRITNNVEEALHLFAPTSSNPAFSAELTTNAPGKGFELVITGKKPLTTGTMNGQITLKTSSTNSPSLTVPFWANVQAPVMVFPAAITLQPALTNKVTSSITIQNNSTNQLTVSGAEINIPGVEVQFKETQPGKVFSAQLVFPEGFHIPKGTDVLFTAKSSNPDYPVIRVPIRQLEHPSAPPAVPTPPAAAAPRAQVAR